ncbi:MAG: TerB family tellurite resistance protein [Candidatus Thermoplasmatota archaeon]|nr:TerB family tellurite resistance protein [Candidatus Thermoplasmatota archaeon]
MSLEELTSFTSKDRILLYLTDFQNMEDRYELPADLTQQSIAYGTGVQRKHLSQYLNDLIEESLIIERKGHIQGMKQRMNGYYLAPAGFARASSIKSRIGDINVPVRMNGKLKDMMVKEIDDATSVHITFCDIVREAIHGNGLKMEVLETVESRKREALEQKEQDTDVFRRALQTAWRDGRVTATERFLVEELRKHLKVTEEQQRTLESEIIKSLAQDHMEFRRIYMAVLEVALADRVISGPEESILEQLRRMMRISRKEHDDLVREAEASICGPPGCEKDLLKDAMRLLRDQGDD